MYDSSRRRHAACLRRRRKAAGVKTMVWRRQAARIAVNQRRRLDAIPDGDLSTARSNHLSLAVQTPAKPYQEMAALERFNARPATRHYDPDLLLGTRRQNRPEFPNETDPRLHGPKDRCGADRRRQFCRRPRRCAEFSCSDEEGTSRRTLSSRCGKLDLLEVFRPARTVDKSVCT
jgi:hypothetical protein